MEAKFSVKKFILRRFSTPRINVPKLFRWVIVLVIYLALFSLLDGLTRSFQLFPGVATWYPPDGLSLAFLLAFGVGFTPIFTLASLISSLIIYRFSTPLGSNLVWAVVISIIYGIDAFLLRRRVRIDPHMRTLRDILWLLLTSTIVSTLLAGIAISGLVNYGAVPPSQYFNASVEWWIGEMIGVLVLTPFLLVYGMPWVKRFVDGEWVVSKTRIIFHRPSLQSLGQIISIPVVLYAVFGIPALRTFEPYYLMAVPLIWIALKNGFSKVSLAIVGMNFGTVLAIWLFKFDPANLADLHFLLFGIYASTLLTGAIVTRQKKTEEVLRQSEKRFRALVTHSLEEISLVDPDGTLTYESPTSRRPLGYPPDSFVGHSLFDLFHPDEQAAAAGLLEQIMKNPGSSQEALFRLRHLDGSWRWMEGVITNLLDEPAVQSLVINYRDITERKLAETERNQSEALFRALFELSPDSIVLIDPHDPVLSWPIIDCNKAACLINGYSPNELIGQSIDILNTTVGPQAERTAYLDRLRQAGTLNYEVSHRHKDGSIFPVEVSTTLFTVNGREMVLGIDRDITSRKLAEKALQESEHIFRSFLEQSEDAIMLSDSHGILIQWSKGAQTLTGYSREESLGQTIWDIQFRSAPEKIKTPENHQRMQVAMQMVLQTGQGTPLGKLVEAEIQRPEGTLLTIQSLAYLIHSDSGVLLGNILRDITERKQAEVDIKISNDELSMLFELSHALAEADTLEDVLGLVNRHAVESIHTTFARIALLEDGKYTWRAAYPVRALEHDLGVGQQVPVAALPFSQRFLELSEPMIFHANDPHIPAEEKKVLLLDFVQSVCLIPLRISDSSRVSENLIGLLMLGEARSESRESFKPGKLRLAQTIADSAAIAIRRMLLREQTERRLQQLTALSKIDHAISSTFDLHLSLGLLLQNVSTQLRVDATDILLFKPGLNTLEYSAGRGFRTKSFEHAHLQLGEGYAGQAALNREIMHISDLTRQNDNPRLELHLAQEQFVGYYAVPLIARGEIKGVLEIFQRAPLEPDKEWLDFLATLAGQASIAIDSVIQFENVQRSNSELSQAYDETIKGWSRALDLRDNETEGHTQRVTELTVKLGRHFLLSEQELVHIKRGALLHDIGKMGVPDGILLKPGPLTDEEWVIMKKHTTFAFNMLSPIQYLRLALDIPYCHHEKWDGSGYPRGLRGEQIPFAARLFAVVDVFDALVSDRPYRAAWPKQKALDYIISMAGSHFDPQVVQVCVESGLLENESSSLLAASSGG